mgnify:CR=1 FL=1
MKDRRDFFEPELTERTEGVEHQPISLFPPFPPVQFISVLSVSSVVRGNFNLKSEVMIELFLSVGAEPNSISVSDGSTLLN